MISRSKFWSSSGNLWGKKIKTKCKRNLQQKGNSGYPIFSLPYTEHSKGPNKVGGEATIRLCTAELFRDPGEVLKRLPGIHTSHKAGKEILPHIPFLCFNNPKNQISSGEKNITRGYLETGEKLPHRLGFGITLLCMGTARKFWVAPISFQSSEFS